MLSVQNDLAKAMKQLRSLAEAEQLAYATSVALNKTAREVQDAVKDAMPRRFMLRSNWVQQGIRLDYSNKRKLEAVVYSRDKFMGLQEVGGEKTPHGNYLAIPTTLVRRTPRDRVKRSETPAALGDKLEVVTVGRRRFLALKKRRKGASANMLRLMYILIPRASVKKRLGLNEDGIKIARAKFLPNLRDALEQAVRSAK